MAIPALALSGTGSNSLLAILGGARDGNRADPAETVQGKTNENARESQTLSNKAQALLELFMMRG